MSYQNAELGLLVKLRALDNTFKAPTGVTTPAQRQDAVRAAIMPWLDVTYTIRNGRRVTMAMQYADVFGGEVLVAQPDPNAKCEHGIPRKYCTGVHE